MKTTGDAQDDIATPGGQVTKSRIIVAVCYDHFLDSNPGRPPSMTSIFPSENGNASGSFCLGQIFARACRLVLRSEDVNTNDQEDKGVIQKQREHTEKITNCKGATG